MRHHFHVEFDSKVDADDLYKSLRGRVTPLAMPGTLRVSHGAGCGRHFVELEDVRDFHDKFGVPMPDGPHFLNAEAYEFRTKFLREELVEFEVAHHQRDMLSAADALVDMAYVLLGTALMMGLPWQAVWSEVQSRNMAKQRAQPDGSDSKRGTKLDVVKPPGWTPPDHSGALGNGPWSTWAPEGASGRELEFAPRTGVRALVDDVLFVGRSATEASQTSERAFAFSAPDGVTGS